MATPTAPAVDGSSPQQRKFDEEPPTVTDANLVLGYLNPKGLLGGRLPLDLERARKAIKTVAGPLDISVERAAYGMFTIVNSNMVNGIRRVSVERGYDPRDFVLVGAGGATAAHITFLAGEMGIDTIILPKLASGLCAFGQIISDVKYNYMATSPLRLEGKAYATISRLFEQIEAEGVKHLRADGFAKSAIRIERSLDMRYVGQVHECTVEIANFTNGAEALEINDAHQSVRVGVDTWVVGSPGSLTIDSKTLSPPYSVLAIGDPPTLAAAMNIPGGAQDSIKRVGARMSVQQADRVDVTTLRQPKPHQYAQPVK